jgi:4-hydroxybenzoyl-CoA thioesterase
MKFISDIKVRFGQVDMAGIVFYPRYFEMINQVVEDWFAALDFDFQTILVVRGEGVPLVHVEVDFRGASRLGDLLRFELGVDALGTSTIRLTVAVSCQGEERLTARLVLAYVTKEPIGSLPLPEPLRGRLVAFQAGEGVLAVR